MISHTSCGILHVTTVCHVHFVVGAAVIPHTLYTMFHNTAAIKDTV